PTSSLSARSRRRCSDGRPSPVEPRPCRPEMGRPASRSVVTQAERTSNDSLGAAPAWVTAAVLRSFDGPTPANHGPWPTTSGVPEAMVAPRGQDSRQKETPQLGLRGFGVKTLAMTYSRMLGAHYHRRVRVSLPSSGWDRVVPRSYCHQGEGGGSRSRWIGLLNAHTLSLVASEQAHEAACRRRISWDVAKLFAPNIDVPSSPRPLEVIWSSHTDH